MARRMYKYPISIDDVTVVSLRGDIKHIGIQDGSIFAWAEHLDQGPAVEYHLQVFGTGSAVPQGAIHVGTVFQGLWVWHIYQVG